MGDNDLNKKTHETDKKTDEPVKKTHRSEKAKAAKKSRHEAWEKANADMIKRQGGK